MVPSKWGVVAVPGAAPAAGWLSRGIAAVGCGCACEINDKIGVNTNVASKNGFLMVARVLKGGDCGTCKDIIVGLPGLFPDGAGLRRKPVCSAGHGAKALLLT